MKGLEATYFHIRVLIGMVVGLAIGNLLRGAARVIADDEHRPVYRVQFVWAAFMLAAILHFWWWEIRFDLLPQFTFPIFAFWILYVLQLFFLTALLMPEKLGRHENNQEHFLASRRWFFGFLALFFVLDFAESLLKGGGYVRSLGPMYPVRNALFVVGCLFAIGTANPTFHRVFAGVALASQLAWLAWMTHLGF